MSSILGRSGKRVPVAIAAPLLLLLFFFLLDGILPSPLPENIAFSAKVVDRNGETLRMFTTEEGYWRFPARLEDIDSSFISFLIAYEDKRFWSHCGVDPLAVGRACIQMLGSGRVVSGASTLTMQTVRLLRPRPRTVAGKIIEMIQAIRLEMRLSKKEILELYLGLAPYGGNLQGIEAASFFYFGIPPKHLTPSRAALLVSLPQSPETRRPDRFPRRAKQARDAVLARFYAKKTEKLLTKEEYGRAVTRPVPRKRRRAPFYAPQLTRKLHRAFPEKSRIVSTIDLPLQRRLEEISAALQKKFPQTKTAAIVVVENDTRAVRARIGSGSFKVSRMDLTTAIRSPGSTLKPFIYGLAFERGILHPETIIFDRPQHFGSYGPENFDKSFHGPVSIRKALRLSLNIPAVQVLDTVGPQKLLARFAGAGIPLYYKEEPGLALALGGVGIRLTDLTALYASLADGGRYIPLRFRRQEPLPSVQGGKRLLSPAATWYIDDILRSPESLQQTGERSGSPNQIRYKTGTSYGFRDAWAMGYNNRYTVGVWVGRIDGGYDKDSTGLNTAVPVMRQVFANLPGAKGKPEKKTIPKDVLLVSRSGLPQHLQSFGKTGFSRGAKLLISYPVAGSRIPFTEKMRIPLKASGGTPPFHWLVNGKIIGQDREGGEGKTMCYAPKGRGELTITLIDNAGEQAKTKIRVD